MMHSPSSKKFGQKSHTFLATLQTPQNLTRSPINQFLVDKLSKNFGKHCLVEKVLLGMNYVVHEYVLINLLNQVMKVHTNRVSIYGTVV